VGQFEVRVKAHRPREGFFRAFQVAGYEIGHAQVVEERWSVGL
jgi:hypothetical protein